MSRTRNKFKGLSLDRLETLSAIVAQGGISRASGGDPNKQSQFSRQVAELEAWFGFPLLDRTTIPSKPTQAAERIVLLANEFGAEMAAMREASGNGRKTVIFGAGERMIRSYLIPWAARAIDDDLRLVFRNLTSDVIRMELLNKRLDFGILKREKCPRDLATMELKPIPLCFVVPSSIAVTRKEWTWKRLEGLPLVVLEGDGDFVRFLKDKALAEEVNLDLAIECSSWKQVVDAMNVAQIGGFLPKDLLRQLPPSLIHVPFRGLNAYAEEYVIAWSRQGAKRRAELARLIFALESKPSGP